MGRPREHDGHRDAAGVAPPVVPVTASRRDADGLSPGATVSSRAALC